MLQSTTTHVCKHTYQRRSNPSTNSRTVTFSPPIVELPRHTCEVRLPCTSDVATEPPTLTSTLGGAV